MNLLRALILVRFFFFLLIVTTLFSCNKINKYDLGEGLSQNNPGVRYLPNLPVNAVTIKSDSEATGRTFYQLGGEYYDPYFGRNKAVLMQEFFREKVATFDGTPVLDSIVWSLSYKSYYGDATALNGTQIFKVYEITGGLTSDNTYYSNGNPFSYTNATSIIGTYSVAPYLTDSVVRIKLSNTLGDRVLNVLKQSTVISNELKGLMLYPDNPAQTVGQGAIFSFNLLDQKSKLLVYYHDDSGVLELFDGLNATGSTNTQFVTQRASLFSHDYTNAAFAPQLNGTATDTNHIYIQSMTGTSAKIEFPILNQFKDSGKIVINKAEVIFTIDEAISDLTKYTENTRLYLLPANETTGTFSIPDQQDFIPYSNYDPTTHQFKFNIGIYFQDVLNGKLKNYGMRLFAAESVTTAQRTILKTKGNIIFNLTYTKF